MNYVSTVLPILVSIFATGISIISLLMGKRQNYNQTITGERLKWTDAVRELIADFIENYLLKCNNHDSNARLIVIKSRIDLLLNHKNSDHFELSETLTKYLGDKNLPIDDLIAISQTVFKNNWERMKWETGFSKKRESKVQNFIYGNVQNKR